MNKITLAEIAARSRQLSESGQSDCPVMEERDKVRGWHPLLIGAADIPECIRDNRRRVGREVERTAQRRIIERERQARTNPPMSEPITSKTKLLMATKMSPKCTMRISAGYYPAEMNAGNPHTMRENGHTKNLQKRQFFKEKFARACICRKKVVPLHPQRFGYANNQSTQGANNQTTQ